MTTVVATDVDPGTTLTYAIVGGADAQRFVIDAATGALSFVAAPDFEAPADQDGNNSYVVQVRASDGSLSDLQTITVNVTDVSGTIIGDNGDNVLAGTGENDLISGGGGDDTAVFNVDFNTVKVVFEGSNDLHRKRRRAATRSRASRTSSSPTAPSISRTATRW